MATFNITTAQNIDELASKGGGDTYNINGGTLTIDQDSRYGTNAATGASLGNITISSTLGGTVEIDARYVRLIPYDTGTGTVPAYNTTISQGSASGKLIGVYSALTVAPTAPGAAMPASGYIKIKQWNSVSFSSGALTGISASATGGDVAGWIELVGDESATITAVRLGLFRMRGEWYALGTTSGTNTTTYQIPSNGSAVYVPGVWVETAVSSGSYEFYPRAGSLTATAANMATDAVRGKVCWISTAGVVRFNHDGTNSTGGYLPVSGLNVRVPNIFATNCTTAARTTNTLPNTTLATRYDFTATGGVISIDKANLAWFPSFAQSYSVSLTNTGVFEQILVSELASPVAWDNVGVGQTAVQAQLGISLTTCLAGGTISNSVFTSASLSSSGRYTASFQDIDGFTFNNCKWYSVGTRGHATTGCGTLLRVTNCNWNNCSFGVGRQLVTTCTNLSYYNTTYWDTAASTTLTTFPMYMFELTSNTINVTIDTITFGGLALVQPYSGILNIGAAGCSNIKLRNMGTYASPISLGDSPWWGQSWSRTTTTATVTTTGAHNLKTGDSIYVMQSSSTAAIVLGTKTVTVTSSTVFTFTCLSAGSSSGTLSFSAIMSAYLVNIVANAVANNIKIQRCYTPQTRTAMYSGDNSSKNIRFENCLGDYISTPVTATLNTVMKGVHASHALTAQTNPVYGSSWLDIYTGYNSTNTSSQSWSRTTTTATVTANDHKLRTNDRISVTSSSSVAAIVLGIKTVTVLSENTFTFTCLNAGGASGTLSYDTLSSRIVILMNEATTQTSSQYTIDSGTPSFTSAGGLYMPTVNDQLTFEMPGVDGYTTGFGGYLLGHTGFPIEEAIMAGGTIGNYDITYAIDKNDGNGYSTFRNLYYPRSGASGTSGQNTFTVTDGTGVEIDDYVWGTGIAPSTKVTNVAGNTITVDTNNVATVSGVLRFNHLPSETSITASGFKMKCRIKTSTTNATAITSLYWFTKNTETSRGYQYDLDIASVTLTGLVSGTEIRAYSGIDPASCIEIGGTESSGTSFTFTHGVAGVTGYIVIVALGYQIIKLPITYSASDVSIPIQQQLDRQYNNPS
ncbi:MAG: hypothetical protein ACXW2E_00110 [Nitrososphaeraceae archaeon]